MAKKVLIAYSTKYGSTQETAEAVSRILKEKFYDVEILACKNVKKLEGFSAIVIGTPLYAGSLLSDTMKFLSRFKSDLQKIPTALFVLGPMDNSQQEIRGVQMQLDANLKKVDWFKPVDKKIFVGALRLEKLRFPDSLIKLYRASKDKPMRSSDNRDWKDIQAWAASLPGMFNL